MVNVTTVSDDVWQLIIHDLNDTRDCIRLSSTCSRLRRLGLSHLFRNVTIPYYEPGEVDDFYDAVRSNRRIIESVREVTLDSYLWTSAYMYEEWESPRPTARCMRSVYDFARDVSANLLKFSLIFHSAALGTVLPPKEDGEEGLAPLFRHVKTLGLRFGRDLDVGVLQPYLALAGQLTALHIDAAYMKERFDIPEVQLPPTLRELSLDGSYDSLLPSSIALWIVQLPRLEALKVKGIKYTEAAREISAFAEAIAAAASRLRELMLSVSNVPRSPGPGRASWNKTLFGAVASCIALHSLHLQGVCFSPNLIRSIPFGQMKRLHIEPDAYEHYALAVVSSRSEDQSDTAYEAFCSAVLLLPSASPESITIHHNFKGKNERDEDVGHGLLEKFLRASVDFRYFTPHEEEWTSTYGMEAVYDSDDSDKYWIPMLNGVINM